MLHHKVRVVLKAGQQSEAVPLINLLSGSVFTMHAQREKVNRDRLPSGGGHFNQPVADSEEKPTIASSASEFR